MKRDDVILMFDDKVAIITGAGSGIGREVALQLAEQGAKVVVVNRTESKGLETVRLIEENGGKAIFVQADVGVEDAVKNYVDKAISTFGQIDLFFNNAGISGEPKPLHMTKVEEFDDVFNSNVKGVYLGLKYVIEGMLKTGSKGVIVNTSSTTGVRPLGHMGLYSASKHAVRSLTKTTALEYIRQGIRINAVSPGFTMTNMSDEIDDERMGAFLQRIPAGRGASVEEMAKAILFLLGDESAYMVGSTLVVDGGSSL